MTGRVTMLGISRWTGKGGSYRTIQRFFQSVIHWDKLNWLIAKRQIKTSSVLIFGGDATTVTKAGKWTHGIGRFFSSIDLLRNDQEDIFALCLNPCALKTSL